MMPGDENGAIWRARREPMRQRLDLFVEKRLLNFDPARLTERRDGEARTIAILKSEEAIIVSILTGTPSSWKCMK